MMLLRFLTQTIGLALGQIRANKARALLTALGIIIGVGSVTAVVAALTGMRTFVLKEFQNIGARYITIDGNVPERQRHFKRWQDAELTIDEVRAIAANCPSIEKVSPVWRYAYEVRAGERTLTGVRVTGIWPTWHDVEQRAVIKGRPFTSLDDEGRRYVALVNDKAVEELDLSKDPVGDELFIGGRRFLIIGMVETKAMAAMFGGGEARTEVYIPFETAVKLRPDRWINEVGALAVTPEKAEEAKAEATFVLRKLRNIKPGEEDTFEVRLIQSFIDQFNAIAAAITAVAGGIVSVSLLVGGIGIMNIMLVSVSERTREIGLRKAVGAKPSIILTQFLVEAVVLCAVGGLIGLILGQAMTLGLRSAVDQLKDAAVPPWAIALAFFFSAGVGVIFGMFPAVKASRLDPIEALRHE